MLAAVLTRTGADRIFIWGLLITFFASSIEQLAARSSLISLIDHAPEFNALMPMLRIPATVNFGGCQDYGKHRSDV